MHHENYAVVFNLYFQSRKKSPLKNYNCGVLNAAEVQRGAMAPVAMQMQAVAFHPLQQCQQRSPAPSHTSTGSHRWHLQEGRSALLERALSHSRLSGAAYVVEITGDGEVLKWTGISQCFGNSFIALNNYACTHLLQKHPNYAGAQLPSGLLELL